jgi:hypothetical protein
VPPTSLVERPTRIHQDSQIVNENQTRNSGYLMSLGDCQNGSAITGDRIDRDVSRHHWR